MDPRHQLTALRAAKDVAPFLKQLRIMLEDEHPAVVRWTAGGRAFEIVDMEQMTSHVLPKYFKHRKYSSFQRQLNYFNFRKWTKSKATVCTFSNEFFRRDQPELAWRITRKKSAHNGTGHQQQHVLSPNKMAPAASTSLPPTPRRGTASPLYDILPVWARECGSPTFAINVPATSSKIALCSDPLSSPTDLNMVFESYDHSTTRIELTAFVPPAEPLESLGWIDELYPFVEAEEHLASHEYPITHGIYHSMTPPNASLCGYVAL